ncbi:MAG: outer membrane beta-barrel protein [bacterium]
MPMIHSPERRNLPGGRTFLILFAFISFFISNPALASVRQGTHVIGLLGGVNRGIGRLGDIADTGFTLGFLYRHHLTGNFSAGFEMRRTDYGSESVSNAESDVNLDSNAFIARWDLSPDKDLRPYLLCGLSLNRYKQELSRNTAKSETASYKLGESLGIGLDRDLDTHFSIGGQLRYLHVGSYINSLGLRLVFSFRFP